MGAFKPDKKFGEFIKQQFLKFAKLFLTASPAIIYKPNFVLFRIFKDICITCLQCILTPQ